MLNSTIEIINGPERRCRWRLEEKLRIVAETHGQAARDGRWQPGTISSTSICCARGVVRCAGARLAREHFWVRQYDRTSVVSRNI
jgi:hypothetical protein